MSGSVPDDPMAAINAAIDYTAGNTYNPSLVNQGGGALYNMPPASAAGGTNIGTDATAIGKALKDLQAGLKDDSSDKGASSPQGVQAGTAASGTGQGSPAGINALIQLLLQRSNQYFPGQPNRQPVALPRPSGGGLLGI